MMYNFNVEQNIKKSISIEDITPSDLRDELFTQLIYTQRLLEGFEGTNLSEIGGILLSTLKNQEELYSACIHCLQTWFPITENGNSEL